MSWVDGTLPPPPNCVLLLVLFLNNEAYEKVYAFFRFEFVVAVGQHSMCTRREGGDLGLHV